MYQKRTWLLLKKTKFPTQSQKKFVVFSPWLVFNQHSASVSWLRCHKDKSFRSYFRGLSCCHHCFINLLISFVITNLRDFSPFQELCMNLTSRSIWPLSSQLLTVRFRHLKLCVKTLYSGSNEPITTTFLSHKPSSLRASNCKPQALLGATLILLWVSMRRVPGTSYINLKTFDHLYLHIMQIISVHLS